MCRLHLSWVANSCQFSEERCNGFYGSSEQGESCHEKATGRKYTKSFQTHAFHIITSGLPQDRNPLAKCICPLAWSTNQNEQRKKMSALNLSIIRLGVKTAIPGGLTRLKGEENGNIMNYDNKKRPIIMFTKEAGKVHVCMCIM